MDAHSHIAVPIRPRPSTVASPAPIVDSNSISALPKPMHPDTSIAFSSTPLPLHTHPHQHPHAHAHTAPPPISEDPSNPNPGPGLAISTPTGAAAPTAAIATGATGANTGPVGTAAGTATTTTTATPCEPVSPQRNFERARLTKFYHFLCSIPVMTLRRIAKEWGRKQYGLKKVLVARIYLFVLGKVDVEHRALDEVIATSAKMPDFDAFIADARMRVLWDSAPSKAELQNTIGDAAAAATDHDGHESQRQHSHSPPSSPSQLPPIPFPDNINNNDSAAALSSSEAARLLLLIRTDPSVKHALRVGVPAADDLTIRTVWHKVIEPRFNDPAFRPVLPTFHVDHHHDHQSAAPNSPSFRPETDVDTAARPPLYRTASVLAENFVRFRPVVAAYVGRWRRASSPANPLVASFYDLLPRAHGGELAPTGDLVLALFRALEPWTSTGDADARLLGLAGSFAEMHALGSNCAASGAASGGGDGASGGGGGGGSGTPVTGAGASNIGGSTMGIPSRREVERQEDDDTDGGSDTRQAPRTKRRRRGRRVGAGGLDTSLGGTAGLAGGDGNVVGGYGSNAVGSGGGLGNHLRAEEDEGYGTEFLRGMGHALRVVGERRGEGGGLERSDVERRKAEAKLDGEVRLTQLQIQTHLIKSMAEARRLLQEHGDDSEFKGMLQHHYASLKDEYLKGQK